MRKTIAFGRNFIGMKIRLFDAFAFPATDASIADAL